MAEKKKAVVKDEVKDEQPVEEIIEEIKEEVVVEKKPIKENKIKKYRIIKIGNSRPNGSGCEVDRKGQEGIILNNPKDYKDFLYPCQIGLGGVTFGWFNMEALEEI